MRIEEIKFGDYTAKINLDRGANCISLRNRKHGAVILREPDYSAELDNPYLYGMPILFPVNRIEGGSFEFEGRTYTFPVNEPKTGCHLHGELHHTPFELVKRSESRIVCRFRADAERPYLGFPHAFEITVSYRLSLGGLTHVTKVKNLSDSNMPVFIGFHTTFNSSFIDGAKKENIRARVDILREFERNMDTYLPTGKEPAPDEVTRFLNSGEFNPFSRPISRHYESGPSGAMALCDRESGVSVMYRSSANLGYRLIYNGQADGYICLEPQSCIANCQNSPFERDSVGFDFIAPGETKTYKSRIFLTKSKICK